MSRFAIMLLVLGCEYDPLPADAPCREMRLRNETTCPHPSHRLKVTPGGGGCNSVSTTVCICEAPQNATTAWSQKPEES